MIGVILGFCGGSCVNMAAILFSEVVIEKKVSTNKIM